MIDAHRNATLFLGSLVVALYHLRLVAADAECFYQPPVNKTNNGPAPVTMLPTGCPDGLWMDWDQLAGLYPLEDGSATKTTNASFSVYFNDSSIYTPNVYAGRGYTITAVMLMACYVGDNNSSNPKATYPYDHIAFADVGDAWTSIRQYEEEYAWVSDISRNSIDSENQTFTYEIPAQADCTYSTYDAQIQFVDANNTAWILILDSPLLLADPGVLGEPYAEESTNYTWLVILLTCLLAACIAVAVFLFYGNQKLKKLLSGQETTGPFRQVYPKGAPPPTDIPGALTQVKGQAGPIDSSQFVMMEIIGLGEFGAVYKGALFYEKQAAIVAIKTLKPEHRNEEVSAGQFHVEAEIMKSLDHPNIVSMIGLSTVEHDEGICECLIMEYMGLGDLRSYIKPSTQSEDESGTIISTKYITLHEKLWHCLQIARGMEYLASVNIVHRDLAARNCMLSDPVEHTSRIVEGYEFSPGSSYPVTKIADFGLSRMFDENERQYVMSNSTLLPVRWLSIEAITDRAYTEKSDCWAFAVTCWEVFSDGAIPYQDLSTYNLAASVAAGTRLTKPAVCPLAVFDIIKSGWEQDVEKRPTFKELRQKLEGVFMTASMEYLQNNETFKGGLKSEESMAIEDPSRYEYPYTTITAPETAFLQADTDMTYLNLEDTRSPDMLLSRRDKQDDITEEAGYVVMNGAIRRPTNTQDESRGSEFRSQARGFSGDTSIYLDGNLDTAIEGVYNMYPPR